MLHSRSFIHSDKVIGVKVTKAAVSGPWQHAPPTLPTHATWFDALQASRGHLPSVTELQVFYPFFWLHSLYFPVCSLSPSSTSEGSLSSAMGQLQRHLRYVCSGQLFLFLCFWWSVYTRCQPRVTAPGMREG